MKFNISFQDVGHKNEVWTNIVVGTPIMIKFHARWINNDFYPEKIKPINITLFTIETKQYLFTEDKEMVQQMSLRDIFALCSKSLFFRRVQNSLLYEGCYSIPYNHTIEDAKHVLKYLQTHNFVINENEISMFEKKLNMVFQDYNKEIYL